MSIKRHAIQLSDGSITFVSGVPGVLEMDVLPEGGVSEVARVELPDMTEADYGVLIKQAATKRLEFDTLERNVTDEPTQMPQTPPAPQIQPDTAEGANEPQ